LVHRYPVTLLVHEPRIGYSLERAVRVVATHAVSFRDAIERSSSLWRRSPPPVLMAHGTQVSMISVAARRLSKMRFPVVCVEHGLVSQSPAFNEGGSPVVRWALRRQIHKTFAAADQVVAVSQAAAEDLAITARVPIHDVLVINNPVVSPHLRAQASAPAADPWITRGQRTLLAVGRLVPEKAMDLIVRAFHLCAADDPDLRLIILGEGPERRALLSLAVSLRLGDRIAMPGFVANPYSFMARSTVLVHASTSEGMPTAVIEAMACDTPVVAINSPGGMSDALGGGLHGILVDSRSPEDLASGIRTMLRVPPKRWNLRQAVERFGALEAIETYAGLISSMTSGA
jgi:glycosyltransferase involved in cell wall biosynthesis